MIPDYGFWRISIVLNWICTETSIVALKSYFNLAEKTSGTDKNYSRSSYMNPFLWNEIFLYSEKHSISGKHYVMEDSRVTRPLSKWWLDLHVPAWRSRYGNTPGGSIIGLRVALHSRFAQFSGYISSILLSSHVWCKHIVLGHFKIWRYDIYPVKLVIFWTNLVSFRKLQIFSLVEPCPMRMCGVTYSKNLELSLCSRETHVVFPK